MAKAHGRAALVTLAALVVGLSLLPGGCSVVAPPQSRYAQWLEAGHRAEVERYAAYLRAERVHGIVPTPGLLRTSRRWRVCGHPEFAVPPASVQAHMPPTLRLVAQLHAAGLVDPALARSVYRDPAVNACAGGSTRSRHLENRAIDFDLPVRGDNVARLCAFWRTQGRAANMGLGFYTPTAIHVDTAGYRTWGTDFTRRSSLCTDNGADQKPDTR